MIFFLATTCWRKEKCSIPQSTVRNPPHGAIVVSRHAGCTQVDRWIDFGTIYMQADWLNQPRFRPSLSSLRQVMSIFVEIHFS